MGDDNSILEVVEDDASLVDAIQGTCHIPEEGEPLFHDVLSLRELALLAEMFPMWLIAGILLLSVEAIVPGDEGVKWQDIIGGMLPIGLDNGMESQEHSALDLMLGLQIDNRPQEGYVWTMAGEHHLSLIVHLTLGLVDGLLSPR